MKERIYRELARGAARALRRAAYLGAGALRKAHIRGHYRTINGKRVWVRAHEDARPAGKPERPRTYEKMARARASGDLHPRLLAAMPEATCLRSRRDSVTGSYIHDWMHPSPKRAVAQLKQLVARLGGRNAKEQHVRIGSGGRMFVWQDGTGVNALYIHPSGGEYAQMLAAEHGLPGQPAQKSIGRREDVSAADRRRAVQEYGNVRYADPVNKKYPVDTPEHVRAAWAYINMPRNAAKYSAAELKLIKQRIKAAAKRQGVEIG